MKLARLLRFLRLIQKIDRYAQYSAVVLLLLITCFSLIAHWFACLWCAIGYYEFKDKSNSSMWKIGWVKDYVDRIQQNQSINETNRPSPQPMQSYLTALYFACSSMTSVGFGNVSANTVYEKMFSICFMLVGALMHAAVFGNVTAIIQRMYGRRAAYQDKSNDLKDFTRAHHIPKPLRIRMQEFFQTMWALNRGIHPDEILRDFPEELRGDIALHLNRDFLSLPLFGEASQGCLKSLAQHVKTTFCTPGEYLVHSGDVLKYLYYVCSGSLEILDDDMVVALLGKGDVFGCDIDGLQPPPVHNRIRSSSSVKSLTYCDIQCIELSELLQVLDQYPEFERRFAAGLHEELSFNIRAASQSLAITDMAETAEDEHGLHGVGDTASVDRGRTAAPTEGTCASSSSHAASSTSSTSSLLLLPSDYQSHAVPSAVPAIQEVPHPPGPPSLPATTNTEAFHEEATHFTADEHQQVASDKMYGRGNEGLKEMGTVFGQHRMSSPREHSYDYPGHSQLPSVPTTGVRPPPIMKVRKPSWPLVKPRFSPSIFSRRRSSASREEQQSKSSARNVGEHAATGNKRVTICQEDEVIPIHPASTTGRDHAPQQYHGDMEHIQHSIQILSNEVSQLRVLVTHLSQHLLGGTLVTEENVVASPFHEPSRHRSLSSASPPEVPQRPDTSASVTTESVSFHLAEDPVFTPTSCSSVLTDITSGSATLHQPPPSEEILPQTNADFIAISMTNPHEDAEQSCSSHDPTNLNLMNGTRAVPHLYSPAKVGQSAHKRPATLQPAPLADVWNL